MSATILEAGTQPGSDYLKSLFCELPTDTRYTLYMDICCSQGLPLTDVIFIDISGSLTLSTLRTVPEPELIKM